MPRSDMKPITSVIVVNITPPAKAGSIFNLDKISGRVTPLIAPITRLIIRATAITNPRKIHKEQIKFSWAMYLISRHAHAYSI